MGWVALFTYVAQSMLAMNKKSEILELKKELRIVKAQLMALNAPYAVGHPEGNYDFYPLPKPRKQRIYSEFFGEGYRLAREEEVAIQDYRFGEQRAVLGKIEMQHTSKGNNPFTTIISSTPFLDSLNSLKTMQNVKPTHGCSEKEKLITAAQNALRRAIKKEAGKGQ